MKIRLDGETMIVSAPTPGALHVLRSLPVRKFRDGAWEVAYVVENYAPMYGHQEIRTALFDAALPPPSRSAFEVDYDGKLLVVRVPSNAENLGKCKAIPDRRAFSSAKNAWVCPPTPGNISHVRESWPEAVWLSAARDLLKAVQASERLLEQFIAEKEAPPEVTDYRFSERFPPMEHQRRAFAVARNRKGFAFLMEQGTGKTAVTINNVCYLHVNGKVEGALVICPNSVKDNWVEEIAKHSPEYTQHHPVVWNAGISKQQQVDMKAARDEGKVVWLVMNVEAASSDKGVTMATWFLANFNAMMIVDESSRIKNHSAKRTKAIIKLGKLAPYRRILTGTPVTQSPMDAFPQFAFLDPDILGFQSFYAFRNHFAVMGGYNGKEVVGFVKVEELQAKIAPHSFRVLQKECLDLPEVTYDKLVVELAPEQKRLYKEMKAEMIASVGQPLEQWEQAMAELHMTPQYQEYIAAIRRGRSPPPAVEAWVAVNTPKKPEAASVTLVLTQMLRLQQIVGGFLPLDPDEEGAPRRVVRIDGPNPKLQELLQYAEDHDGKVIVWSRFRPEIALIADTLRQTYGGETVVEFHGGVSKDDRTKARHAFQDPKSPVRWFVGQQETGGIGINLTEARHMVVFSNTFKLEDRLQMIKRTERYGMAGTLLVTDLIAKGTIDVKVHAALREKKNLADLVTGDKWTEWL